MLLYLNEKSVRTVHQGSAKITCSYQLKNLLGNPLEELKDIRDFILTSFLLNCSVETETPAREKGERADYKFYSLILFFELLYKIQTEEFKQNRGKRRQRANE